MLGLLTNRWLLGSVALLVVLGLSFWKGYSRGKDAVQREWDAERVAQERKEQEWKDQAIAKERTWQDRANKAQKERIRETQLVNRRYNALIDSLRERPEVRAGEHELSDNSGNAVGCTGEGLARPDAGFLAGYAADAARLQAAYNSCREAYDSLR